MRFNYYRIIYFNLILLLLFLCNQFCLFFIIFFYKIPYLLNLESDIEYEFNFQVNFIEDVGANYLENDIDNDFYYTLQHMQSYLYANCRFFFDVLGGESTLDYIDFIDFTIYKINDGIIYNINRNYKYIYNNNQVFIKTINYFNKYKLYNNIDDAINNNYELKKIKFLKNLLNKKNIDNTKNKEKIKNKIINIMQCNKNTLFDKQIKIQKEINYYNQLNKTIIKNKIFMIDETIIKKVNNKKRVKNGVIL
jgi:hypothetical protein